MKIYRAAGGKRVIRWKVSRDGDREEDRKQRGNTAPRDKWLTIDKKKEPS